MKRRMKFIDAAALVICAVVGSVLVPAPAMAQASREKSADVLPQVITLDIIPPDAKEVAQAGDAKAGEAVSIRGRVSFAKDAFTPGMAEFVLCDDDAARACMPTDGKVLDSCPVGPAAKARVRIVKDGQVLAAKIDGKGGLKAGAEVFVVGRVVEGGKGEQLVIDASAIHVPRGGLPVGFVSKTVPADAKDVSEARKAALKKGQEVVLRGVIGGGVEPFVSGRAMLTLMGSALKPCNAIEGDGCKSPWDYCCETKQDILANSVTVRVIDAKGIPLKTDLKGRWGMKELSEIVVVGTVASSEKGGVIVNATSIYVARP